MSFSLPEFNLECDIFTGPWDTRVLRVANQECNLQFGRKSARYNDFTLDNSFSACMNLLLPALTDIRSTTQSYVADSVEVPSGSGRIYLVVAVDDTAKGFDNEYRVAVLVQASEARMGTGSEYLGLWWPTPMP